MCGKETRETKLNSEFKRKKVSKKKKKTNCKQMKPVHDIKKNQDRKTRIKNPMREQTRVIKAFLPPKIFKATQR